MKRFERSNGLNTALYKNYLFYNSKSGGGRRSIGGVGYQDWTEAGQRAEPAAVHRSTGHYQQEDGDEGCHEETPLLSLVANDKHELQEILEEWNGLFSVYQTRAEH